MCLATLISVGSSVPSNGNVPINIDLSSAPTPLAAFGLTTPAGNNRVFLEGTVGVVATLLTPTLIFRVVRDNSITVATIRQQLVLGLNQVQAVSFNAVDSNVTAGAHGYTLTVEVEGLLADATVVGPIIFSGESYQF